jgi:hypothetical protein
MWGPLMFPIKFRKVLWLIIPLVFAAILTIAGCGMRQSKTGSLSSRIIDADGNAVQWAQVFSIFRESEKVYTGPDGGFYLAELPEGLNNIVILHQDYLLEERQIEVRSNETTFIESIRLDNSNAPNRISNVKVVRTASTSATISWNTYKNVACNIDYGTTRSYDKIFRESRPATEHEVVIDGLTPETLYHFRVQYIDEKAFTHYSFDYSFKTFKGDYPGPPGVVSLLPIQAVGKVQIEWQPATASSVVGYNVYRGVKDEDWQLLTEEPLSDRILNYEDNSAPGGRFVRYAITAVNEYIGESVKVLSETVFIPGTVSENVRITRLDSPVVLDSDILITAGATFEVESGVEFRIRDSDLSSAGYDEQRVEINVAGRLRLLGTEEAPIRFVPLNGSMARDHWAGIKIMTSETGISQLNHVKMSGCARYAIEVEAERVELDALSIAYSVNGLRLNRTREDLTLDSMNFNEISDIALKIESCRRIILRNSQMNAVKRGVVSEASSDENFLIIENLDMRSDLVGISGIIGQAKIKNALIVCPDGHGINIEKALHSSENYIDHCTIDAKNGIELASGSVVIENNIIVNRRDQGNIGINNTDFLVPSYNFNNIFGFTTRYQGCGPEFGGISTDPMFKAGNPFDYNLRPESPLNLQDRYGGEMGRYGTSRL